MSKCKTFFIALVALAFTGPAMAQDTLLEYLIDSCETDLKQYCSQVNPGEGRLMHCVAAHSDQLSSQCEYALYQAASLLEQLSMAIAYVAKSCETEIDTVCAGVEAGEGRILQCFAANEDKLGAECKKALQDTVGE